MLPDLTSDYMRFINTATLQEKKDKLIKLNTALTTAGKNKTLRDMKEVFLQSFKSLLEIIIAADFDEKKLMKLLPQRYSELFNDENQKKLWTNILLALELDEL